MPPSRICPHAHCSARQDSIFMIGTPLKLRKAQGRERRRAPRYVRWTCPRCGHGEIADDAGASAVT